MNINSLNRANSMSLGTKGRSGIPVGILEKALFLGYMSQVVGGEMPNYEGDDVILVSGPEGSEEFQCPVTQAYIDADTDNLWFQIDETPRVVTTAELIGYDFERTLVKYDNNTPNIIRAIMILKAGETLLSNELNYLFRVFALHPLWNDSWNDNGVLKSNRGLERIIWIAT